MDAIEEWTSAQARVIDLAEGLSTEEADASVPACPDWRVRDLLAHMIGLDADVLAGDEPDDHNAAWTQRQVDQRKERSVEELVTEWRAMTEPMRRWMAEHNPRPLGDVIIHEQDLRSALGRPGAQDSPGFEAIRDRMASGFATSVGDAGLPPVVLQGSTWTWASGEGDPAVVVASSDFDLGRSLMSRRTAEQLRGWTTTGDIDPYLDAFAALGSLPDQALPE